MSTDSDGLIEDEHSVPMSETHTIKQIELLQRASSG